MNMRIVYAVAGWIYILSVGYALVMHNWDLLIGLVIGMVCLAFQHAAKDEM